MRQLWVLALLMLGACDPSQPIVVTSPPRIEKTLLNKIIPTGVLSCLREPDGSAVTSIRQSATYVIDLKKAGRDCRQKLQIVRNIIQREQ